MTKKINSIFFLLGWLIYPGLLGCGIDDISTDPRARFVHINVEPENSRVVVKSMTDSSITTLPPPYDYHYILRPYSATYVEVTHQGYRKKIIKLDGTREEIDVKLEKLSEEEMLMQKYKTGAAGRAGPSLSDIPGAGGASGESPGGRPGGEPEGGGAMGGGFGP